MTCSLPDAEIALLRVDHAECQYGLSIELSDNAVRLHKVGWCCHAAGGGVGAAVYTQREQPAMSGTHWLGQTATAGDSMPAGDPMQANLVAKVLHEPSSSWPGEAHMGHQLSRHIEHCLSGDTVAQVLRCQCLH